MPLSFVQIGLSFVRNFDERKAPSRPHLARMLQLFRSRLLGGKKAADGSDPAGDWEFLWIGSMWFQDLWTYDFRRTEMCVIPYATQEGEISFCAYNTGVGWRQIVENMHMVATTSEWFQQKGRHTIYAGDRPIPLPDALKRRLPVVSVETGNGKAGGQPAGGGCGTRLRLSLTPAASARRDHGEPWDLGPIDEERRPALQSFFAIPGGSRDPMTRSTAVPGAAAGLLAAIALPCRRGLRGRAYLQGLGDPAPGGRQGPAPQHRREGHPPGPSSSLPHHVRLRGLSMPPETRCSRSG